MAIRAFLLGVLLFFIGLSARAQVTVAQSFQTPQFVRCDSRLQLKTLSGPVVTDNTFALVATSVDNAAGALEIYRYYSQSLAAGDDDGVLVPNDSGLRGRWLRVSASDVVGLPQALGTTNSPTFATVNTGQGANELYAMDQNVRTTDGPGFAGLLIGTGDNVYVSYPTTGLVNVVRGTAANPVTITNSPLFKAQQTVSWQFQPIGDGSQSANNFTSIILADKDNLVQPIAYYGRVTLNGTNTSVLAAGGLDGGAGYFYTVGKSGHAGKAIGFFALGRREGTNGTANGGQIVVDNETTTPGTYFNGGFSSLVGLSITPIGVTNSSVGLLFDSAGQQFDVGMAFNAHVSGGVTGAVHTASIVDDGEANHSYLVRGHHTNAAIAVDAGAGSVLIGGTNRVSASALLEVQGSSSSGNPLVQIGSTSVNNLYAVYLRNSQSLASWAVNSSANQNLIGSGSGDTVYVVGTAGKSYSIGGTTNVIKVGQDNTLGFNNATPVLKQGNTTDLKNVIVNYGFVEDGGATPLDMDGGTLTAGKAIVTVPAANAAILTSTGYSLTGSDATSAVNLAGTLNTSGVVDVFKLAVTDTAHGAGSRLLKILGGASASTVEFSVDPTGSAYSQLGFNALTTGGQFTVASRFTLNGTADGRVRFQDSSGVTTNTAIIFGLHASPAAANTLASASTIAPLDVITFVSGSSAISTITPPPHISGTGGYIMLAPSAGATWTIGTGGNVAAAVTAVANKLLILAWDNGASKWIPSYF